MCSPYEQAQRLRFEAAFKSCFSWFVVIELKAVAMRTQYASSQTKIKNAQTQKDNQAPHLIALNATCINTSYPSTKEDQGDYHRRLRPVTMMFLVVVLWV